ncbi:MAG: insulinase family protein [Prevotellaceae bacterium]|jgi:predicted Zn-dependent peptidase|nr:insulinase family protein [Prevotellaceae bacterium]
MKKISVMLLALMAVTTTLFAQGDPAQKLQQLTLDNGLTVFLWEDRESPDVFGRVVVRAGAIDEPADYTGLAHYLEHMLFKGTTTIGSLDWEKEKPLYEEIIKLYDEYSVATDPAKRDELTKKINEKSMEAAQYTATDDFSNLIEGIGGENLNAFTSSDMTAYHNSFPGHQMEKWLDIYSERLINPVFRSFQAELENVFEEYNMYQDMIQTHQREFISAHIYEGHPYSHDVIGLPEHLKNPNLSHLIEFYNKWYVPGNMALILVGNFDSETTIPLIKAKFGRLPKKEVPAREKFTVVKKTGNQKFTAKVGDYPLIQWIYDGVKKGDKDELLLDFSLSLLNNSHSTGLLDKLMLDGQIMAAGAYSDCSRDLGKIMILCVPYFDISQRRFESDNATERILLREVEKLKNGNIPQWLFNSVKTQYLQECKTTLESSASIGNILTYAYAYNEPVSNYLEMEKRIKEITIEDVQRVMAQYLSGDRITISFSEGDPKKNKLKKPAIKPLEPPKNVETVYAKYLKTLPSGTPEEKYNNFADVKKERLYEGVNLFCTENKKNDVFSLTLRYGVGTEKMPKLEYAAQLLNTAGIMPDKTAQDLRREFSKLGAACGYGVDESYFYIQVVGDEKNLEEVCKLMTRQTLLPKLDNRQIESVLGGEINSRMREKKNTNVQVSALMEYILYKDKSHYIDRIPIEDLYKASVVGDVVNQTYLLTNTELTTTIQEATSYAVDIHFVGKTPADQVATIMRANTPIKEDIKKSESPFERDKITYEKSAIYFLPNSDIQQAKVYFYFNGEPFTIEDEVDYDAFNQYFSGGFSGLVMNEIREKRSMAYTAYGRASTPSIPNKKGYFIGYIGTQSDKVADAVDVYMDLLTNMPLYPERLENIKVYLKQSALTAKPSFRTKSRAFDLWESMGYKDDPAKVNMPKIEGLSFDQITQFYNDRIKGKPVVVVIIGDPKTINLKQIESKWGKITKMSVGKLFKGGI